jgi:hypothetical protein
MLASTSTAAGAVRNPKLDEYEVGGTKYGKHGMETNVTLQSGPPLAAGNLAGPSAVFLLTLNAISTLLCMSCTPLPSPTAANGCILQASDCHTHNPAQRSPGPWLG